MAPRVGARSRALILFLAPAVLLVGMIYHPYIAFPREADVAAAAVSNTTRWGLAHLIVGVGYGLLAVAFMALWACLHEAGEKRWSSRALGPVVLGCALTAILTGMEFSLLTAAETGGDVVAAQEELLSWFLPVVAASGVTFAVGALGFAAAVTRAQLLTPGLTRLVAVALVVAAVARFVPLGVGFYVTAVATVAAFWPVGFTVWHAQRRGSETSRAAPAA